MIPNHICIVPDGNRRYAKQKGWQQWKGHDIGYKKIEDLIEWCRELKIKQLTMWILSTENFNRDKKEVTYLMDLFRNRFDAFMEKQANENVKIKFIGRLSLFPEDIQEKMRQLEEKTKDNAAFTLTLAAGYGGRAEIVDAAKKIAEEAALGTLDPKEVTEKVFEEHLYTAEQPDLIIRTSEKRLSGILPYQGAYAEIIFLDKLLWPEFSKEDFLQCIEEFKQRKRRFGQ